MGNMTELKHHFDITLAELSDMERQKVRALCNAFPENGDVGILVTNSYGLGPDGKLCGLFEKLSRVNHSCRPNSERCWDSDRGAETLYALRDIETGEELTVAYLDTAEMIRTERQDVISASWRFECKCECCSLTGAELKASNDRRSFIKKVEEEVPLVPAHKIFDSVKKALIFLDEEGLVGSPKASMCNYAYQMALCMRNVEEAKSFANEAYTQYLLAIGSISRWTIQMLECVNEPTVHKMWNPLRSTVELFICLMLISQTAVLSGF